MNFSNFVKIFILILILGGGLIGFDNLSAAQTATLSLSPSGGVFNVGDVFNVDILLNTGNNETAGVDIHYLNYDPSLLEVQDADGGVSGIQIQAGALYASVNTNLTDATNGKIDFSQTSSGGATFNGSGVLATVSFKAIAEGTANLTFDFTKGSTTDTNVASDGADVLNEVTNGSYAISQTATLSLSPSGGVFNVGDVFDVDISLNTGNNETAGVDIHYLNYDPSLLEVQDADGGVSGIQIQAGALYASVNTNLTDATNGKIDFSQTSSGGATFNGSGVLATVSFKAIAEGTANLTFDFTKGNPIDTNVAKEGVDILGGVNNSSHTITSSSSPPPPPPPTSPGGGGISDDTTAPARVIDFQATGKDNGQIMLTWQNPKDSDFLGVSLIRATNLIDKEWSKDTLLANGGKVIYKNNQEKYTDTGLDNSKTYYYAIYTYDKKFNYSKSVIAKARPLALPYPNGSVLTTTESDKIYFIVNYQKRWIVTPEVFISYGLIPESQITVSKEDLDRYELGPDMNTPSLSEGSLISGVGDFRVYIIKPPFKRHIFNPDIFNMYGHFSWDSIRKLSADVVTSYITSDIYRSFDDYRVYSLEEIDEVKGIAIKHHLNMTGEQFADKGYRWDQIFIVNPEEKDYYQTGSDLTY